MKTRNSFVKGSCLLVAALLPACAHVQLTHVAPGQSLDVALAKKPELIRMPAAPHSVVAANSKNQTYVPAVEPDLPKADNVSRAADAFSQAEFCIETGNEEEAIKAFQEVVRIDPAYPEAWQNLAKLYEKKGDTKKAIEAFRRAKKLAGNTTPLAG